MSKNLKRFGILLTLAVPAGWGLYYAEVFLLVPTQDSVNADGETKLSFEVLGGLDPPPLKVKQVASGEKYTKEGQNEN
jgi:hypothetical protein